MARVALLKCESYDSSVLYETIESGLVLAGFDPSMFQGARVALKPNLLVASAPEKAIITHPLFFDAIARIVKDNGGSPVLMECPPFTPLAKMARKVGYLKTINDLGMEIADVDATSEIYYEGAKTFKRIDISKALYDFDIIVNLPKFKTHGFTYMSGAVKNLFGVIPGLMKSRMHLRCPEKEGFSDWLLDLNGALLNGFDPPKTFVHIMDAVVGQEGEGPGPAGTPREIGAVMCSEDPVALDWVSAKVVGFDIEKIQTITYGFDRDFYVSSPDEIEVAGKSIEEMLVPDFKPTRSSVGSHFLRGFLVGPRSKNLFMEKPVPSPKKCSLCYQCKTICPAGVITKSTNDKIPAYDYNKCIRCFCCMEVCPEAAISIKRGRLQWLLGA
jgi:uncharacterized protein (DUF362 family)/Pyruvate/2-oxoacid:ferredoxin oxidoreductase delta subunit